MPSGPNSPGSDSDSADEWAAPPQPLSNANAADAASAVTEAPAAAAGEARSMEAMDAVERDLAGESVPVVFELPDGTTYPARFYMGQSVEHMKAQLEKERGMPYEKTTLHLGDRMLFDPLSLSDLPFNPKAENHVRVTQST